MDLESTESLDASCETESVVSMQETSSEDSDFLESTKSVKVIKRRPEFSDTIPAIPVASFKRLVRAVTDDQKLDKQSRIIWESKALEALHVGAEAFVIDKFNDALRRSNMCKKKTVGVSHFMF